MTFKCSSECFRSLNLIDASYSKQILTQLRKCTTLMRTFRSIHNILSAVFFVIGQGKRVQHIGLTFRKYNDFTYRLRLCCFSKFFSHGIIADKQMFKDLMMVELLDLEEEEETKGRRVMRTW